MKNQQITDIKIFCKRYIDDVFPVPDESSLLEEFIKRNEKTVPDKTVQLSGDIQLKDIHSFAVNLSVSTYYEMEDDPNIDVYDMLDGNVYSYIYQNEQLVSAVSVDAITKQHTCEVYDFDTVEEMAVQKVLRTPKL